jgi:hypothetical protein
MPTYTIRDPQSGRTLTVRGDSPPSESELEQLFASQQTPPTETQPSEARPTFQTPTAMSGGNYMVSGFQAAPEAQAQGVAGMVRYAAPVAATLATGGLGLAPAMLASGAATAGGEALAQGLEGEAGTRNALNLRQIAASGIAGSVVPVPLRAVAGAVPSATQGVVNFLTNAGAMVSANEAAQVVEKGEFVAPQGVADYLIRVGAPVALAGVGSAASMSLARQQARIAKGDALIKERFGTLPMLGEVMPSLSEFEARRFQGNNVVARRAAENMDANLAGIVKAELVDKAPNPDKVARQLLPYVQDVEKLRTTASQARAQADNLANQATQATASDLVLARRLADEADAAAVEAVKQRALYTEGTEKMLGSSITDVSEVAKGARLQRLSELADAADKSVSVGLGRLYGKAGLELTAPVARVGDVRKNIARMVSDPVESGQLLEMFEAAIKKPGMLTNGGDLTLAGYRNVRDLISDGLVNAGGDRSAATRKAGQAYNAAKSASETYISSVYPQNIADSFKAANKAAASIFESRTGIIDDIRSGNVDKVVRLIEDQGYGPVAKEIQAYSAALGGLGDDASKAAARQFTANMAGAIRDHLVDTSMRLGEGIDEASRALDVSKLVKKVDSLRQKGMSPEALGFPNSDAVKALARVATTPNKAMDMASLSRFMDDVALSGVPIAEARLAYDDALRKYMTASNAAESTRELNRLSTLRKQAEFGAGEADKAYQRAVNDPLVRLFNEPGLSVSPVAGANPEYVSKLLASGENGVQRLSKALQTPVPGNPDLTIRRLNNLAALKKSAIADVFGETFRAALGPGDQRLRLERITDFFYGPTQKTERDAFRSLIGKQEFGNLEQRFAAPIKRIFEQRKKLGVAMGDVRDDLIVASGALGQLQGRSTAGVILGNYLRRALDAVANRGYGVLYGLYVDPVISRDFLKAKGDINAFVNSSPRNAMLYQMMVREDEANNPQQSPAR